MYMHLELRGEGAGELSYLLDKNPDRLFEWEANGSMVRVFFPVYRRDQARAVVVYWPDPAAANAFVHGSSARSGAVGPRPFAVNSLFVSALEVAFGALLREGTQDERAIRPRELEVTLCPVCTYLGPDRINSLFEPLGYQTSFRELPGIEVELPTRHPRLFEITLRGIQPVEAALRHVMVMALVLDSDRHEYMKQQDIERLAMLGKGWLASHPEGSFIVSRFLLYRRLVDTFVQKARRGGDAATSQDGYDAAGEPRPQRITPETYRTDELVRYFRLQEVGSKRLLVVGAGDLRLLAEIAGANLFAEVVAMDSSASQLEKARRRLERSERYSDVLNGRHTRVDFQVSALGYRDTRMEGFDVALLAGVVERIPSSRLIRTLVPMFEQWRPGEVVIVVPNQRFELRPHDKNGRRNGAGTGAAGDDLVDLCRTAGEGAGYAVSVQSLGEADRGPTPFLLLRFSRDGGES